MFLRFGYKKLLREVCDRVLKDPTVSETVRVNRAKVVFSCFTPWGDPLTVLRLRLGFA